MCKLFIKYCKSHWEVNSLKKIKLTLIIMLIAVSMLLVTGQVAMATVTGSGATGGAQTGSSSGTSGGGKTGAEVVLFAAVGAGLLGTGYMLTRKAKA